MSIYNALYRLQVQNEMNIRTTIRSIDLIECNDDKWQSQLFIYVIVDTTNSKNKNERMSQ